MKRWVRGLLILIPLALVALCGVIVLTTVNNFRDRVATATGRNASATAAVERRNLDDLLSASGSLQPERIINLSFETSGTIREIAVRAGDAVKAGDILAALDTTVLEQQLEQARQNLIIQQANYDTITSPPKERDIAQARAALAQAEAQLAQAQANYDNQQNIITQSCANLATLEDNFRLAQDAYNKYVADGYQFDVEFRPNVDSALGKAWKQARDQREVAVANCASARRAQSGDAAVKSAMAAVEQATAALKAIQDGATKEQRDIAAAQLTQAKLNLQQAERNLSKATLRAPADGIITAVNVSVGQVVGAGGQAVMIMADTTKTYLEIGVDENDISRVKPGQKVRFTLQGAAQDRVFNGEVISKNPNGQASGGVIVYPVKIAITDSVPLFLSMTADVDIVIETRNNVLTVPTRAVRRAADGTQFVLVQVPEGNPQLITVRTGITVGDVTEVSGEGLREGQTVLLNDLRPRATGGLFGGGAAASTPRN